ncbi:hypothetical protein Zmor_015544 [Zophobas morio]|uniref:Uncharacterized protein n=1 Tax=Zophobas morio TaxID=2755281 RepID=A0AA38II78_9CUCU|nr:hypothetical protein Zmor_015544 [Zophobas morio]
MEHILQRHENSQFMETLTNAIENNHVDNFKKLVLHLSRNFFLVQGNNHRITLYMESMKKKRKEIFDFLLTFHPKDDAGTIAALDSVLSGQNSVPKYYVDKLLKKYSSVTSDENLLVIAVRGTNCQAAKFLLNKGLDPNAEKLGYTPLHTALVRNPDTNSEELITTLLCNGADALGELHDGYNCFELAVIYKHTNFVQEMSFDFAFDYPYHSHYKLNISVLLQLAKLKSPLFHQLRKYDVEFFPHENKLMHFSENLRDLLQLEFDYFEIIFEEYNDICCHIFETYLLDYSKADPKSRGYFFLRPLPDIEMCFGGDKILKKFDLLLHGSTTLNKCVIEFIHMLNSKTGFHYISKCTDEANVTEFFAYLLPWGLRVGSQLFDDVFQEYGYCELFKLLLFLDYERKDYGVIHPSALVFYICEVNSTLHTLSLREYTVDSVFELMNYFVHSKLDEYRAREVSSKKLAKKGNYPHIPSLVELARNTFREYFVTKLDIRSTQRFYTLLNSLPISVDHKKIISLETKLYDNY